MKKHHKLRFILAVISVLGLVLVFLALLARYPGRVLTHQAILQEVWGPNYGTETQYLRVYAGQIRKKLEDDMRNPRLVTDLGVGYRLQARAEPAGTDQSST